MSYSQKVLDGATAGFIAAVANALSRNISAERMDQLIKNPDHLKRILMPVINDDWIDMLPAIAELGGKNLTCGSCKKKLVWVHAEEVVMRIRSNEFMLKDVVAVAKRKNYAFLEESEADQLSTLLHNGKFTAKDLTGRARCVFPFKTSRNVEKSICMFTSDGVQLLINTPEFVFRDHFAVFFFYQGWNDGSDACSM